MTIDSECIHGLTPDTCSICKHGLSRPEPLTVLFQFRAKYDGKNCGECNLPIYAGQFIVKLSDESYRHSRCRP